MKDIIGLIELYKKKRGIAMTDKMTEYELEELETFEQEEGFQIKDLDSANWAFKKLLAIESKAEENEALAEKELERINDWLKKENESLESSKGYFEHKIAEYFASQKANDPKFKLKTPYGKVMTRKQQPAFTFNDDKVLEYLKDEKPEMVYSFESYNKPEMKKIIDIIETEQGTKVIDKDGTVLPFIKVEHRPDSVTVKTIKLN